MFVLRPRLPTFRTLFREQTMQLARVDARDMLFGRLWCLSLFN